MGGPRPSERGAVAMPQSRPFDSLQGMGPAIEAARIPALELRGGRPRGLRS